MISTTLVVYFVSALTLSFICSLLEAVLLSTTHSHVQLMLKHGRPGGKRLAALKQRIDRPLIAILTLNTLANMFGSAGVGAEASRLAIAAGRSDALPVAIAAGILTACILVFSEIVPKTLGATYWRSLAGPAAELINVGMLVLWPVVLTLEFIPRLISQRGGQSQVTRDEVLVLTEMGRQTGSIPTREGEVIANLLRLNLLRVRDVMTPRVELFALQKDRTAGEVMKAFNPIRYSRIPVFNETTDQITGVVLRHQIVEACLSNRQDATMESLQSPVHFVPESKSVASVLDEFIRRHEHLFIVVNEYGGTEGVITLEDVIEALLGVDISDEMDGIESLRRLALERMASDRQARQKPAISTIAPGQSGASHAEHRDNAGGSGAKS